MYDNMVSLDVCVKHGIFVCKPGLQSSTSVVGLPGDRSSQRACPALANRSDVARPKRSDGPPKEPGLVQRAADRQQRDLIDVPVPQALAPNRLQEPYTPLSFSQGGQGIISSEQMPVPVPTSSMQVLVGQSCWNLQPSG
jgi:hypothetical protein